MYKKIKEKVDKLFVKQRGYLNLFNNCMDEKVYRYITLFMKQNQTVIEETK